MASERTHLPCDFCGRQTGGGSIYYFCPKCKIRQCFSCRIIQTMKGPIEIMGKCPMCKGELESPE